VMCETNW